MKIKIPTIIEEDVATIRIIAAVNYGEEEIPNDFPGRKGDLWMAKIEIATGRLIDWPVGRAADMHLTVKDGGNYALVTVDGREVAKREDNYVPHGIIPGNYGDTIELLIGADGVITNWPKHPDASDFTNEA